MHGVFPCRFPHSDTRGSLGVCPSPQLFAAYHVFHRLLVPRHPPCALFCLTSSRLPAGLLHSVAALFLSFLGCLPYFLSSFDICKVLLCSVWNFQGTCLGLFYALAGLSAGRSSIRLPRYSGRRQKLSFQLCLFYLYLFISKHRLAATCFPMPSPAQYPRPPAS